MIDSQTANATNLPTTAGHSEADSHAAPNTSPETAAATPAQTPSSTWRWTAGTLRTLPTLVVLALLAAVGYWGHQNGWKVPKLSELLNGAAAPQEDWCVEHNVPESACVACQGGIVSVDLTDSGVGRVTDYGWCQEHGVHQCPHCHADVAQLKETPDVTTEQLARITSALAVRPRTENNSGCKQYQTAIQFASSEAVAKAGVDVEPAQRESIVETILVNGEITYDQNNVAEISSRAEGSIVWVGKETGDEVQVGEVLAIINAADVGHAKSDLKTAITQVVFERANVERLLPIKRSVAAQEVLQAETALRNAENRLESSQQRLRNLGFRIDVQELLALSQQEILQRLNVLGIPNALVGSLPRNIDSANLLPVTASIGGTIINRHAVEGEVIDTSRPLFQLADTSRMWLNFNIPVEEAGLTWVGQKVSFRPDGMSNSFEGKIKWLSTSIDRTTRTLPARAELTNPGDLRNEMFGAGHLVIREDSEAVMVPSKALQRDGSCYIVFVRDKDYFGRPDSPKLFHTRSVRIGAVKGDKTELIAGVLPGEIVATVGSDVLRGQLLKSNLGAG